MIRVQQIWKDKQSTRSAASIMRLILLLLSYCFIVTRTLSSTFTSDSCKCTGGEPAACECKVSSPSNATMKGQMDCGCTGPTPLECVCDGNRKELPSRSPAHAQSSTQDCIDKCQASCLETCVMLELDSKCGEICSDACYYSCKKQEKARLRGINKKKNEYKFIIPNESTATTEASVLLRPYEQRSTLFPIPVAVSPYKKCESECMPDCSLTCTTFKPALELISGFVDGRTKTLADCRDSCTGTCAKVCVSTGVSPVDCVTSCGPACEASCQQALKVPKDCPPACMPSCQPECMEQISRLDFARPPTAAPEVLPTSKLQHRCVRECKMQCDRQCAMYEYPNTNCEEACISSCFPVCQGKALQYYFPGYGQ